jgi:hypothetical protein
MLRAKPGAGHNDQFHPPDARLYSTHVIKSAHGDMTLFKTMDGQGWVGR